MLYKIIKALSKPYVAANFIYIRKISFFWEIILIGLISSIRHFIKNQILERQKRVLGRLRQVDFVVRIKIGAKTEKD